MKSGTVYNSQELCARSSAPQSQNRALRGAPASLVIDSVNIGAAFMVDPREADGAWWNTKDFARAKGPGDASWPMQMSGLIPRQVPEDLQTGAKFSGEIGAGLFCLICRRCSPERRRSTPAPPVWIPQACAARAGFANRKKISPRARKLEIEERGEKAALQ
jgi:hypothetical protein